MLRIASRSGAALAALLLVAGCATNPVTGRREFTLVTTAQEEQIGREGFPAVVAEYGVYEDVALQAYVDSVGGKLARASHLPNAHWKFTVLDDPVVNAFAMPGGYIYVTRGILAHLNSEAQLAGVLGHEIGHVTARHSAQRLTQQQLAGIGLGLVSVFAEGFQRYSQAAQTGLQLLFLKYGRDDETQADELGVQYTTAAGYDPREIPATYAMLKRVSERAGQRLPEFLSTHPDPGNREERTRALAAQAAAGKGRLVVNARDYVKKQDGEVFGPDPRQGYFDGDRYYHPSLRFQMVFPAGWKRQDTRSAVMAAAADGSARLQVTLAPESDLSPSGYVAELVRTGRVASVIGGAETVAGFPAWMGRLTVPGDQGQTATLAAGYVRFSPQRMFQVLGRSPAPGDPGEAAILSCARSFRSLADPARLDAQPDRVKVVSVAKTTTFQDAVQSLGVPAERLDEIAILNNAFADQDVRPGELIKIVAPGRR